MGHAGIVHVEGQARNPTECLTVANDFLGNLFGIALSLERKALFSAENRDHDLGPFVG